MTARARTIHQVPMRVLEEAFAAFKTVEYQLSTSAIMHEKRIGAKGSGKQFLPALATLFDGAAEADGGETAEKTAIAAALAAFGGRRGLLLVLHGSLSAGGTTIVLALGRTILSLRVLSLRGLSLRGAVALQRRCVNDQPTVAGFRGDCWEGGREALAGLRLAGAMVEGMATITLDSVDDEE